MNCRDRYRDSRSATEDTLAVASGPGYSSDEEENSEFPGIASSELQVLGTPRSWDQSRRHGHGSFVCCFE